MLFRQRFLDGIADGSITLAFRRWRRPTEKQPAVRAAALAAAMGRETLSFKTDVRKLKELGLTESLEIGYRLSPRGRAWLASQR